MDIAQKGSGTYQLLVEVDPAVSKILEQINGMEKREIVDESLIRYNSYFPWFLGVALLLLAAELFITERKKPTE
jgi:Ca-activated chloride channel family protein